MDPDTHRRFLDYLELRGYFARGDSPKLSRAEFEELDAEIGKLIELEKTAGLDALEARRLQALRRVLLRD